MKSIDRLTTEEARRVVGVFCDIDDTLTHEGRLVPEAFLALSHLREAGLHVVPITGRPAGWVDHLARMWPVDGVVGENGGLWFYMHDDGEGPRMVRRFVQSAEVRRDNRARLHHLAARILDEVPGTALASDQPYRALDVAIDFCEDVPALDDAAIDAIVRRFDEAGATCKVSSIHVNGWFGDFDKLDGCDRFLRERFHTTAEEAAHTWMFVGDSANDAPMFGHFSLSVGVANVRRFLSRIDTPPTFVTPSEGGHGFAEAARTLLRRRA